MTVGKTEQNHNRSNLLLYYFRYRNYQFRVEKWHFHYRVIHYGTTRDTMVFLELFANPKKPHLWGVPRADITGCAWKTPNGPKHQTSNLIIKTNIKMAPASPPRRTGSPPKRSSAAAARDSIATMSPAGGSHGSSPSSGICSPLSEDVLRIKDRAVVRRINTFLDESEDGDKVAISGSLFKAEALAGDGEVKAAWKRHLRDLTLTPTRREMIRSVMREKRAVSTAVECASAM